MLYLDEIPHDQTVINLEIQQMTYNDFMLKWYNL